jgi:lysophospholipase L1-like esterase
MAMPLVTEFAAVAPAVLNDPARRWRRMLRIDTVGGNVMDVVKATTELLPEKLVYAEGDSWFDKFTPIPESATNLLDAIRTPFLTAVVDVAHIGDEVRDMVRGHQARQTRAMFDLFAFDAILLSAGGNDLKNVFADLFAAKALAAEGVQSRFQPRDLDRLARPASYAEFFDDVMRNIGRFVDLRNAARSPTTRAAPIFVHGYDYLQPRPAGAAIFAGSRIGPGPWLYPALKAAGLGDVQMRAAADAVVDEMNLQLAQVIAPLPNVHVIDQRGLLVPAAAGTTGSDADWLDEIHPNAQGFAKLARNRWDVPLSRVLGWQPGQGDLTAPLPPATTSTALADVPGNVT